MGSTVRKQDEVRINGANDRLVAWLRDYSDVMRETEKPRLVGMKNYDAVPDMIFSGKTVGSLTLSSDVL